MLSGDRRPTILAALLLLAFAVILAVPRNTPVTKLIWNWEVPRSGVGRLACYGAPPMQARVPLWIRPVAVALSSTLQRGSPRE